MIYCGADVNDLAWIWWSRPLHQVAFLSESEHASSIIELLIAAGAHTDYRDAYGRLPEEWASDADVRRLLYTTRSRSLKCQCAQLIIASKIPYQSALPLKLRDFVLAHSSNPYTPI